jgi:phage-related baseplate assembly protein
MAITLLQIQTPVTEDEALDFILQQLTDLGFAARSWQQGSAGLTMSTIFARVYSNTTELIAAYSFQGFNDTASADGLTAFSDSQYDNQRIAATKTQGTIRHTNASGAPHIVTASQLTAEDENLGLTYRNTTGGTIPAGGTLPLTYEAETAGAASNVPVGTITILNTPLNGVTITNPDLGAGTWITSEGSDAETDARLKLRNTSKWATRTYATPAEGLISFALASTDNITRVAVDDSNPGGPGTTDVYIAGAAGVSSSADVTTAQEYIDDRIPITSVDGLTVKAASGNVQSFVATIYIETSLNNATTQAAVEAALTSYINTLAIGGTVLPPGVQGYALFSEMVGAMTAIDGVRNVNMTTPAADVAVPAWQILTMGAITFTYTSI